MNNDDLDNEWQLQLVDGRVGDFSLENNSKFQNIYDMHELTDKEANYEFSCLCINIHSLTSTFDRKQTALDQFEAPVIKLGFIFLCKNF